MYKMVIALCIAVVIMAGCTEAERKVAVDIISYNGAEATILFKDGLVITTSFIDDGIQSGDIVSIQHRSNGEIVISK